MDQDIKQLERRCDYLQQQIEIFTNNLNDAKRQIEEKKQEAEFDFKKLMPVGSVWLGAEHLKVIRMDKYSPYPILKSTLAAENSYKEIYHAHQIVKAAQEWHNKNTIGCFDPLLVPLKESLESAEKDGVLQNLE